jgi:1-acyl-sn-glycerol-3-phosphate acyltransferase
MTPLSQRLARLSADEMVSALGMRRAPRPLRRGLTVPFLALSRGLSQVLSQLDDAVDRVGLPAAARKALEDFGVGLRVSGEPSPNGGCLVLANHPGAYDALALMSALGREDLLILAADRAFLRALPSLSRHLVFVGDSATGRALALRRAATCLRRGGAVLHFPAGKIEPDADFEANRLRLLEPWRPGVAALLAAAERTSASVLVAGVRGVHSPRAKRFLLNRLAERQGITTLSPLLQIVGKLRDVVTRVHVGPAGDARLCSKDAEHAALRERLRTAIARA